ncbi:Zinc finger, SWIM-type [Phytophthora cactorum]|nr:Zinc finger, SWIM-type [Phytophthora cactorum]
MDADEVLFGPSGVCKLENEFNIDSFIQSQKVYCVYFRSEEVQKLARLRLSSVPLTIGGKAVNPSPGRAQMCVDSRKGWLNREDGAEQVEQHYLTNHLVEVLSDESLEHNWDSPSWSEKEILTIRRKMLCDCKGFFEIRWVCAHILATLMNSTLAAEIFTRSITTWPSTKNAGGEQRDGHDGQYSVPKLIETLTSSPGSVIGWHVLYVDGRGAKNITGVIRPSEERDEKYFWVVEFDHGAVPDAELDIQELAEILNYTYRAKYDFIQ